MENENIEKLDWFLELYIAAQVVGLASIVCILYWCISYADGFSFSGAALFNWHPLFMTIGMIYLLGNGLLMFRAFRNTHKNTLKLMHFAVNGAGFLFVLAAAVSVLVYHNNSSIPHFYTLHSWIGLIAVVLYLAQACLGFYAFLYPTFSGAVRFLVLPYHVFIGHVILVAGTAAAVSGILEKAIFQLGTKYQQLPAEAFLLNITGVLFVVFVIIVTYLTTNVYYKRYPRPEDNVLLERK